MRGKLFSTLILLLVSHILWSIDVSVTHACFYAQGQHYLQIYTRVSAGTVDYNVDGDGNASGSVAALILIKSNDEIIIADKYVLNSPIAKDPQDFWDTKKYKLPVGNYKLEYTFSDVNNEEGTINEQRIIQVKDSAKEPFHSDLLLLASISNDNKELPFERNGFLYEPLAFDILTSDQEILQFTWELYHLDRSDKDMYLAFYIYDGFTGEIGKQILKKHKRIDRKSFLPIIENFPIKNLSSGQYHITCELYDIDQKLISYSEKNFTLLQPLSDIRQNMTYDKEFELSFTQILTREELDYSIQALQSQVSKNMGVTLNNVLKSDDLETKRYFLYYFWSQVDPDNPGIVYEAFMKVARAVDEEFGNNVGYGFETDKGYIYMKYGRPNDVVDVIDDVNAPPYSIWVYYDFPMTNQNNVKFLFYNPSLSGNDFQLLHSTCNQELQNPRWEQVLYSDAYGQEEGNTFDGTRMQDNFNRNARRYFTDN